MAETELRRRVVEEEKASESEAETVRVNESETDDKPTVNDDIAKTIGQDKPPDALDHMVDDWRVLPNYIWWTSRFDDYNFSGSS